MYVRFGQCKKIRFLWSIANGFPFSPQSVVHAASPTVSEELPNSFVKQEPLTDDEYDDSYTFDNYTDPFDYARSE